MFIESKASRRKKSRVHIMILLILSTHFHIKFALKLNGVKAK